jgi:hypothetical protein
MLKWQVLQVGQVLVSILIKENLASFYEGAKIINPVFLKITVMHSGAQITITSFLLKNHDSMS